MAIRGILFDIGGVLEYMPTPSADTKWEQTFNLQPGDLINRLRETWAAGSIGTISEADVHRRISEIFGLSEAQVNAYMADVWEEYMGILNEELTTYFASLRPRYQTAILSNSFVGARER